MPAYNFMERFAEAVKSGDKRQTIRSSHKGAVPGSTAYLYTGQRTRKCRLLRCGSIDSVRPIVLDRDDAGRPVADVEADDGRMLRLTGAAFEALARDDGFASGAEFAGWFEQRYGFPYCGFLHKWTPVGAPGERRNRSTTGVPVTESPSV